MNRSKCQTKLQCDVTFFKNIYLSVFVWVILEMLPNFTKASHAP